MSRKLFLVSLTALFLCLCPSATLADTVIFSNFGPGMTFTNGGYNVNGSAALPQVVAFRFTSTGDFNFSSAQLALGVISGPSLLQVSLQTDGGGVPGTIIESMNLNIDPFPPSSVATFNSTLNPLLQSGVNYWLVVFAPNADTRAVWNFSLADSTSPFSNAFNYIPSPTGPWIPVAVGGGLVSTFQINGNAAVPEPATMLLLGTGLVGVAAKVGRRRRARME